MGRVVVDARAFRWTGSRGAAHVRAVTMLLALMLALFCTTRGEATTIDRVAISDARIELHFDQAIARASTLLLDAPRRIAVDVAGITPGTRLVPRGPVLAIRQAARANATRVVFDLARPLTVADGGLEDGGRSLVLTLRAVDAKKFTQASFLPPISFVPFSLTPAKPRYTLAIPLPPPRKAPPLPRIAGDPTRPLVVIDAGHGGIDPGAIAPDTGLREKDVTLKIAQAIRDRLLASGRVRVALTRDDDRYLILRERFGIARRMKADLFISIHCDSIGNGNATGASAYTLSEIASDKEAARLAARENKADVIAGVDLGGNADVSSILIDLAQRETMNASAGFARLLGREAQPRMPVKANFHRMASLMVLKAPDMPSILFETGYISNPEDAAFLDSAAGRARIADSVNRAVEVYFARRLAAH